MFRLLLNGSPHEGVCLNCLLFFCPVKCLIVEAICRESQSDNVPFYSNSAPCLFLGCVWLFFPFFFSLLFSLLYILDTVYSLPQ